MWFLLTISGGANFYLEDFFLKRELQWLVCLLHNIEKVYQKYFLHLEGIKTVSEKYNGPIGKVITNGVKLETIVDYQPIEGDVVYCDPDLVKSFNNDTILIYKLYVALHKPSDQFPPELALLQPGQCHQVRRCNFEFMMFKFTKIS